MSDKWNKRSLGFGNNEQDEPPLKRRRREEDLVYEYLMINATDPRQFLMIEDKFGEYFCGKGDRQNIGLSSVIKSESNILPCIVHRRHYKRKSVLFHTQFKKKFCQKWGLPIIDTTKNRNNKSNSSNNSNGKNNSNSKERERKNEFFCYDSYVES